MNLNIDLSFIKEDPVRLYEIRTIKDFLVRNPSASISDILEKRKAGIPLPYILNEAYFYEHIFYVDKNVLIPRSETELVVEQALNLVSENTKSILDLCTGSGVIAITLAHRFPKLSILATDISGSALKVATKNSLKIGTQNVEFFESDLFENIDIEYRNKFDLIISNPPYIGEDELEDLDLSVKNYEPHLALFAEEDGFAIYKKIIEQAQTWLAPNGHLVLEIAPRHYDEILINLKKFGYGSISVLKDYSDRYRIAIAKSC